MVTHNDPVLRLYNGDIGICMPDAENGGQLMVFFLLPDSTIRK
jgi:exodeoxyribonuclease V alpha subunit